MKTKKLLGLFLAMTMVLQMLTACGEKPAEPSAPDATQGDPEVKPVVVQVGYENTPGDHIDLGVNKWAELVNERSGGTMKMEVYPASQLGAKTELIDQMLAGAPVITLADGAFYADRGVPDFGIVFGPYLFHTWDEVWTFAESDLYKGLCDRLAEEGGLRLLSSNWIYGDRNLLSKKPVTCLADLKGMKIRVPSNNIQVEGMAVLGANPTPMALGDVYTALQQGTIDGFEQPTAVIYAGKYYEAAKHLTITEHVKNNTTWICGESFFSTLTPEQQKLLIETGDEAGIYCNEQYEIQTAEAVEALKAAGVTIHEIDMEEFRNAAQAFYELPEFTSVWTEGLYENVLDAMGRDR